MMVMRLLRTLRQTLRGGYAQGGRLPDVAAGTPPSRAPYGRRITTGKTQGAPDEETT